MWNLVVNIFQQRAAKDYSMCLLTSQTPHSLPLCAYLPAVLHRVHVSEWLLVMSVVIFRTHTWQHRQYHAQPPGNQAQENWTCLWEYTYSIPAVNKITVYKNKEKANQGPSGRWYLVYHYQDQLCTLWRKSPELWSLILFLGSLTCHSHAWITQVFPQTSCF